MISLPTRAGRWQMVWQGLRRLLIRDGRLLLWRRLEYDFLACFCALLPIFRFSFLLFFSLHPGMFIFFVSLRLCSSHLLLSATTYFIVRVHSACVICTQPHLGILFLYSSINSFFFRSSYFSCGVFCCCALVPGRLALDLPTMIL